MKNIEAASRVLARAAGRGKLYFNDNLLEVVEDLEEEVSDVRKALTNALKFINEHEPADGELRYRWHDLRAEVEALL